MAKELPCGTVLALGLDHSRREAGPAGDVVEGLHCRAQLIGVEHVLVDPAWVLAAADREADGRERGRFGRARGIGRVGGQVERIGVPLPEAAGGKAPASGAASSAAPPSTKLVIALALTPESEALTAAATSAALAPASYRTVVLPEAVLSTIAPAAAMIDPPPALIRVSWARLVCVPSASDRALHQITDAGLRIGDQRADAVVAVGAGAEVPRVRGDGLVGVGADLE